ncbi:MAG: Signal peptidase I [Candidatus Uhrbacteria bacterium GW2011_GWE2_40_58]|nr:MAG: Signal peptidase I [Candidatus Uhrbacteria bacterium GW2011_GWF2_40_263]KKR67868.1 MAG: Signal peptidase I [Candidatus Uhrbacteria bacterium GW2011_GWE2_40_58]HBK34902.1 signal peptidase I [Candidatus Uhrbacteria bacterium]HCB55512.1 signal peptidase I [Candidatus Uhrbacteria bacterium]
MIRRFFERNNPNALEHYLSDKFGPAIGAVLLFFLEVLQVVLISCAIIIPIRYFLIQPFYVKGASMEPNFYDQEYLIIDELSYRFREPMRGEIIVFRYPRDPSQFFIKRVIGLPGETIEITNGNVIIYNEENPNGVVLEEDYLVESTNGKKKVTLGEQEYYLLGDNRDESLDSRSFGVVDEQGIIGRVWIRGFPLSRIDLFGLPLYNF